MQCKPVTALPGDEKWTFEIKFDGYRCIAVKRGTAITLFSRNEKVLNKRFPKVVDALASLGSDFVLDGELVAERNLAPNTQRSYRDTLVLLIPFVAKKAGKAVDHLSVVDMSAELIRLFLADLETSRRCAIVTRNQRLAAIHALAHFVGEHSPEHIPWCAQLRAIPFKKPRARALIGDSAPW